MAEGYFSRHWVLRFFALVSALPTMLALMHSSMAGGSVAQSPEDNPMRFAVVRSSAAGCEPTCPEWISAEGAIVAATPAEFRKVLKRLAGRRLPVVISSPGGDVDAAMAIASLIRRNKLDVAVGLTRFEGCYPGFKDCKLNKGKAAAFYGTAFANGAYCASACPLILAGGVRRVVGQWASLGVHQITTTFVRTKVFYRTKYKVVKGKKRIIEEKVVSRKNAGSYKTYEMNKTLEKRLAAFLKELGVGDTLLATIKNTPATTLHLIAPNDMLQMKLITSLDGVQLVTAADVCRAVPAAGNCRVVTISDIEG